MASVLFPASCVLAMKCTCHLLSQKPGRHEANQSSSRTAFKTGVLRNTYQTRKVWVLSCISHCLQVNRSRQSGHTFSIDLSMQICRSRLCQNLMALAWAMMGPYGYC